MQDTTTTASNRPLWPPRPIAVAALAAVFGAVSAQLGGVLGVAVAFAPILAAAVWRRPLGACSLAWPASLAAYAPLPTPPPPPAAGPVLVSGEVVSRLVLDDLRGSARCVVARGYSRVLCVFARSVRLHPGDRVRALGRLTPRRGRDVTAAVVDVPAGGVLDVERAMSVASGTEALRLALHDGLVRSVPGRSGRLLAQLVLGHGGDVDLDIADAHRATGLSHLLAVSGAHVSLLAAMLTLLVHGRRRRARPPWTVLVAVSVYSAITGFDPPVVRALVAFALLLAAQRAGRHLPAVAALAAPGVLTAVLQPRDVTSASFALSYAAVAGLALAPVPSRGTGARRVLTYALQASAWATLATAPFTLHLFGQVAPWTILATPLLSPLVAAMLALGLVSAGLGALGVAAPWLTHPLRLMADGYMVSVETLARLPGAPVFAICQPPWLLLVACGVAGAVLLVLRPDRAGVAGTCLLVSLAYFVPWPQSGPARLDLLDVGHGQACILRLREGHNVVVDCGSQGNPRRAADAVAANLAPRRRIDLLVLTHRDADHTAGVPSLLRRTRIVAAVLPAEMAGSPVDHALRRAGSRVRTIAAGEAFEPLPDVRLLRPDGVDSTASNDLGLWVLATLDHGLRALLPGDAGEPAVRAFLASPESTHVDVLLMPHHGRPHAAAAPLLAAVEPHLALVSGGEPGTRCPAAAAAGRQGVHLLETAHVGRIVLEATSPPRLVLERPEPLLPAAK
ncbi:MAG: ComEC/Rec2 family competence protein [Planctomycetota bacterium]